MMPLALTDKCPHCLGAGRPTPPLVPFATELTSDGYRADYQCPMPACLHGWFATWHPDVLTDYNLPEAAA